MSSKWGLLHSNGDREVTLLLTDNPTKLNRDDASKLAFHLNSFVVDMDKLGEPKLSAEGADPEDWKAEYWVGGAIPLSLLYQYVK